MFDSSDYSCTQPAPGQLQVSAPGTSLFGVAWVIGIPLGALLIAFLVAGSLKETMSKVWPSILNSRLPHPALTFVSQTACFP